jgi:hypothetical protein
MIQTNATAKCNFVAVFDGINTNQLIFVHGNLERKNDTISAAGDRGNNNS